MSIDRQTSWSAGSGQTLYKRGKAIIPGGTQLLSKRPEMFAPDVWPAYYSKAKGSIIWDLDGNQFIDMSIMAVGACVLGYADDDVDGAVIEAVKAGTTSSLNAPEEVELAELLLDMHPWFDMVRYARSGGEAMSIAVRAARAATKNDIVLFSGYHGWCDWYLAANLSNDEALDGQLMPGLEPAGVPRGLSGTAIPFHAGEIEEVESLLKTHSGKVAAVVIEPARGVMTNQSYLNKLRELATQNKVVLIYDEITTGFRLCPGGMHANLEAKPDVAVFAKSLANGYPMSAIVGKSWVMDAFQKTFVSSTNWTDRVGPVAALATIKKYVANNIHEHINHIGRGVQAIWVESAIRYGLEVNVSGIPSLAAFAFTADPQAQAKYAYFVRRMLDQGYLGFRQFKASAAHTVEDLEPYRAAVDTIFSELAGGVDLEGHAPAHNGFHRLTKE